jgi:hypothetical protein
MNINRHNYETYFLLWVDGELSSEEMQMVERFINQHPDLADELAALQATRLPLDESIVFNDKESLLKLEQPALSMSSYETYFLLYIDNELSVNERADVELFILQHPALQAEFMLLKQTKLIPEAIVFENKQLLYKKEEKERPIFYMQWRRIAVAAALIGFIFSLWMIVPNKLNNTSSQSITSSNSIKNSTPDEVDNNNRNEKISSRKINNIQSNTLVINNATNNNNKQNLEVSSNSKPIDAIAQNSINESVRTEEIAASSSANAEANIDATMLETASTNELSKNEILLKATVSEDEQPNNLIKQAVYRELDADESSKSLYVGVMEINKDKLRGIIRKAGSIFRSKSKQDEDKIVTNK